jgi:hypothetical protein
MNIFKILSRGDGKLRETNVSAFSGFLLDPKEQHGLGKLFLGRFLELITEKINKDKSNPLEKLFVNDELSKELTEKFSVDVNIEKHLTVNGKNYGDIDVEVIFKDRDDDYTIKLLMEIKINDNATRNSDVQLNKYLSFLNEDESNQKLLVLLAGNSVFTKNTVKKIEDDSLVFISWDEIVDVLSGVFEDNSKGEIDPIQYSTLFLLVSFKQFILSNFRDDVDPKEMKFKINIENSVIYENSIGQSILSICKFILNEMDETSFEKILGLDKNGITTFKHFIANELEYQSYTNTEAGKNHKRFFDKPKEILVFKGNNYYLTNQFTIDGLEDFSKKLNSNGFNIRIDIKENSDKKK